MGSSLGSEQASPTREALMARNQPRPQATSELRLEPLSDLCRACEGKLWVAYHNARTVTTLEGLVRLRLVVRRCADPSRRALSLCPRASSASMSSRWLEPCATLIIAACLRSTASFWDVA